MELCPNFVERKFARTSELRKEVVSSIVERNEIPDNDDGIAMEG